jgi:hypothetical protein
MRGTSQQLAAWIALAVLLATPCAALAQSSAAIPLQASPQPVLTARNPPEPALTWNSLSAAQRQTLAPLRAQWNQLPSARQHQLADHATRWATLPPAHQQLIRERLAHWANMTPAERRRLRDNARAFRNLPPAERAKVSAAFRRFQQLSPAERRALRARWRALPPEQRQRWVSEHAHQPIPLQPPASSGP